MKKNKQKFLTLMSLSTFLLLSVPTISSADCADIKARYWKCTRASMIGEKCNEEDNVSIPPECLKAGSEESTGGNTDSYSSPSNFSKSKTKSEKSDYQATTSTPKKTVKVVNIKPLAGKVYFETEEDVEQFTTKIREELLNVIKEGKKARLQFH